MSFALTARDDVQRDKRSRPPCGSPGPFSPSFFRSSPEPLVRSPQEPGVPDLAAGIRLRLLVHAMHKQVGLSGAWSESSRGQRPIAREFK
jgi:hypothetical protein